MNRMKTVIPTFFFLFLITKKNCKFVKEAFLIQTKIYDKTYLLFVIIFKQSYKILKLKKKHAI